MIKIVKTCKVCKAIKAEGLEKSTLLKRIYNSRQYDRDGESLTTIQRDNAEKFSYLSLFNHCKNHQALSAEDLANRRIQKLSNDIEVQQLKRVISHTDIRQGIMQKAQEMLDAGELKGITATSALAAAKQASDIEEKSKDRQLEVMKMVGAFASGELKRLDEHGNILAEQGRPSLATVTPSYDI